MLRLPRLTALKLGLSAPTAPGICRVESPAGGSTLIDVGAEVREQHRAERPGHHLRDVEHAKAVEREEVWSSGHLIIGYLLTPCIPSSRPTDRSRTLTFNRPEARNAMTWEMYEALVDACDRVDRDAAIRVLILRGAGGKAFVAGTDIAQFQNFTDREDGLEVRRAARPRARSARARDQADDRAGAGRRRRRRLRDRAHLRPARRDARVDVRHPDRAHAGQLPLRRDLQPPGRSASARRGEGHAVHRPADSGGARRTRSASSTGSSPPTDIERAVRALAAADRGERAADAARDEGDDPPRPRPSAGSPPAKTPTWSRCATRATTSAKA